MFARHRQLTVALVLGLVFVVLGAPTTVWAQPSASTPIEYDGRLFEGKTEVGTVTYSSDNFDWWLIEVQENVPVTLTLVETNGADADFWCYRGSGEYPTGSTFSALENRLGYNSNCCVNTRTITFTPGYSGLATVIVDSDDYGTPTTYELSGTGISGAGPVDLVAPDGFFEAGQSIDLSVVLADSSLSRRAGEVTAIAGVDFVLEYDRNLVSIDEVVLGADTQDWLLSVNVDEPGRARIALASLTTLSAVFAELELVTVSFTAIGQRGDVVLSIVESHVYDDQPEPIEHGLIEGTLIVGCDAGDVVKTGDVDTADTIKTLRFSVALDEPSVEEFCAADINDDEVIDASDAVLNLQRVVGLSRDAVEIVALPEARIAASGQGTSIDLGLVAAAGLQAEFRFDPREMAFEGVSDLAGGYVATHVDDGVLRVAAAAVTAADRGLRVDFRALGDTPGAVVIEDLRVFDADGNGYVQAAGTRVDFAEGIPVSAERAIGFTRAAPNPFNPSIEIAFRIERAGDVRLEVFDAVGRHVRSLALGHHTAGEHTLTWNGTDARGARLASGVYNVRMVSGKVVDNVRVVLVK